MTKQEIPSLDCNDYEEILNMPQQLVVVLDADGKIVRSNIGKVQVLGWQPEDVAGLPFSSFIHEADQARAVEKVHQLLTHQEEKFSIRIRCLKKDAGFRWIAWTAIEKEGYLFALGVDASDSVKTEHDLLQQEQLKKDYQTRFTAFFEQSAYPMQIFSRTGYSLAANHAWEILYDTKREFLEGYNALNDPQLTNTPGLEAFQRALQGEAVEIPAYFYDPKKSGHAGRARWIETWFSPVKNENGEVMEVALIHKDVTEKIQTQLALVKNVSERKASEEKLKLLTERFSLAVKSGNIGIWQWVPGLENIDWDETAENIYGTVPGLLPKTLDSFNDLLHPQDREMVQAVILNAVRKQQKFQMDYRIIRSDGELRWIQNNGMILSNEQGQQIMVMGTVMDITERVEAIRTRDDFISIASHELKTPLQSLTLQNQMRKRNLQKGMFDLFIPSNLDRMIDSDLKHLSRINRLIDDMLDITRIREGNLTFIQQKMEFCSFSKDVVERFRPQTDAVGSVLSLRLCEATIVEIDSYRIEQVIVNLLSNAMKYGAGRPIHVEIEKKASTIQLMVHDHGPGIRPEDRGRIFERFERAISAREVSGLGLGLYISKQIMEQNQGSIRVNSEIGKGSTFIMELPCSN